MLVTWACSGRSDLSLRTFYYYYYYDYDYDYYYYYFELLLFFVLLWCLRASAYNTVRWENCV